MFDSQRYFRKGKDGKWYVWEDMICIGWIEEVETRKGLIKYACIGLDIDEETFELYTVLLNEYESLCHAQQEYKLLPIMEDDLLFLLEEEY